MTRPPPTLALFLLGACELLVPVTESRLVGYRYNPATGEFILRRVTDGVTSYTRHLYTPEQAEMFFRRCTPCLVTRVEE